MSSRSPLPADRLPRTALRAGLLGVFLSLAGAAPPAEPEPAAGGQGKAVGKCAESTGTLLEREGKGKDWRPLKPGDALTAGRRLMALPGDRAALDSGDGAVRLTLLGNLPELSNFPVLESVVALNADSAADLDFTLDHGRVDVANRKEKGPARVRVRFHGAAWELTLAEPGAEVGLELFGRWSHNVPFTREKERPPEDAPTVKLVLLVLQGDVDLKAGVHQFALRALPKGPSFYEWDSLAGAPLGPRRLEKLPEWASPDIGRKPEARAIRAALQRQRTRLVDEPVETVLHGELDEKDAAARELAVYGLAAIDDLPGLVDALNNERRADVRTRAVEALRHWIGRGPKQDLELYRFLVEKRKYTEGQAEILVQLLHGFADSDLSRPETYEILIAYLRHDKLPIRELTMWHLYRLVPGGKDIKYDPAGSESQREAAYKEWKALVPEGKLPPRDKPRSEGK